MDLVIKLLDKLVGNMIQFLHCACSVSW